DFRVLECAAQGGVGGLHQRHRFSDGDGLLLRTGLKGQVNSNFMTNFQRNVLAFNLLEPFGLGADRIGAGNERGSVILPGLIGGQCARHASLRVYNGYGGAGYDAAALIRNGSEDPAETAL